MERERDTDSLKEREMEREKKTLCESAPETGESKS